MGSGRIRGNNVYLNLEYSVWLLFTAFIAKMLFCNVKEFTTITSCPTDVNHEENQQKFIKSTFGIFHEIKLAKILGVLFRILEIFSRV